MTAAPAHTTITIGTRKSRLAQWQTRRIAHLIEAANPGVACRAVEFTTVGDKTLDRPLPDIGGKGVFTQELEEALRDGHIDAAVHSLKDLPTEESPGLVLRAVCEREDARDVFISRDASALRELSLHSRVGTSSVRRTAQLLALRPDLQIVPLRGNVDTRVRKANAGEYDGIVIAAAGVHRLGLTSAVREYLSFEEMLPAPGQGALGVQCRADDAPVQSVMATIDDPACRAAVTAERTLLQALGGGCAAPVGAYAEPYQDGGNARLRLQGAVAAADGRRVLRTTVTAPMHEATDLGRVAAAALLADGAKEFLS